MDQTLFTASNDTPARAASAPGETVPAWLYRRTLYLLAVEATPASPRVVRRIRNELLDQTAIRIPQAVLRAITDTQDALNPYVRNRIHSFTEAQMRPGADDFQIQPVPPICREADPTAGTNGPVLPDRNEPASTSPLADGTGSDHQEEERTETEEDEHLPSTAHNQVSNLSAPLVDAEFTEDTGTANEDGASDEAQANIPHTQLERRTPVPQQNVPVSQARHEIPTNSANAPASGEVNVDANVIRRQTYGDADLLLGLDRPAPARTATDQTRQAALALVLLQMNASEMIGELQGSHVQPTGNYLSGTEELFLLRDERGMINHARPDEVQSRSPFQGPPQRRAPQPDPPAPVRPRRAVRARPSATQAPTTKTKTAAPTKRPRQTQNPLPAADPPRETRKAKRKREEDAAKANNQQANQPSSNSANDNSEEVSPPAKKTRVTLKIDLEKKQITKGSGGTSEPETTTSTTPSQRLVLRMPTAPAAEPPSPRKSLKRARKEEEAPKDGKDSGSSKDGKRKTEAPTGPETATKSRKRGHEEIELEGGSDRPEVEKPKKKSASVPAKRKAKAKTRKPAQRGEDDKADGSKETKPNAPKRRRGQ